MATTVPTNFVYVATSLKAERTSAGMGNVNASEPDSQTLNRATFESKPIVDLLSSLSSDVVYPRGNLVN